MQPPPTIPPGWYPDPSGLPSQRYWNGAGWTGDVAPVATRRPSVAPTILITFFFSFFGLIPAIRHSRLARARGFTAGRYWAAFWGILLAPLAFFVVVVIAIVAASPTVHPILTGTSLSHVSVESYIETNPTLGNPTGVVCNNGIDIQVSVGGTFSCVAGDGQRFNVRITNVVGPRYEVTPAR